MHPPSDEVVFRLLLAKSLLDRTRMLPVADADDFFVAQQVLTAHDAADLAIGAIGHHCGALTKSSNYLMDNIAALTEAGKKVAGIQYMGQLNAARNAFKHAGNLPNKQQFARATDKVYEYVAEWCNELVGVAFAQLHHADLLQLPEVREYYKLARVQRVQEHYEQALVTLGEALHVVFRENSALRGLSAGVARPEDAIKLAGFGVHGNDYLALQEFLPTVREDHGTKELKHHWKQREFGHPANWREDTVDFCLRVFLDIAVKIQRADWIPGAIDFKWVYEYRVTALETVNIWKERPAKDDPQPELLTKLEKGSSLTVLNVTKLVASKSNTLASLMSSTRQLGQLAKNYDKHLQIVGFGEDEGWWKTGFVDYDLVKVTCVPKSDPFVARNFPNLTEIPWQPKLS